jgi:alkylation response protein AidB-like acyl-CoA dehydrogenase
MIIELTNEQKEIRKAAREFAQGEFDPLKSVEFDEKHEFPRELYKKAAELGFIGLDYPEEYGGGGSGVLENVLTIESFCQADSGIGMAIHLAYLPAKIVRQFGNDSQKKRILPKVARGEYVSAVSFTEADHGSDLTKVDTVAIDKGDRFILNGSKIFTTNASYADFFVVLVQTDPEARPARGMATLLIEKEGKFSKNGIMEITEMPTKMGLRMVSSGEINFRDFEVPKENLLGENGRGLINLLEFLDESRIEIAAQSLGTAEGAFLKALSHAREREQFGKPIIEFQGIGHKVARMFGDLMSAKSLLYYAAKMCDHGGNQHKALTPMFTAIVKYLVPEHAKGVIDQAINVFGGYGYFLEQEVERRYRDNRICEIYEGTVEVQLNTMLRTLKSVNFDYLKETLI